MKYDYINEHKEKGGMKINLFNKNECYLIFIQLQIKIKNLNLNFIMIIFLKS